MMISKFIYAVVFFTCGSISLANETTSNNVLRGGGATKNEKEKEKEKEDNAHVLLLVEGDHHDDGIIRFEDEQQQQQQPDLSLQGQDDYTLIEEEEEEYYYFDKNESLEEEDSLDVLSGRRRLGSWELQKCTWCYDSRKATQTETGYITSCMGKSSVVTKRDAINSGRTWCCPFHFGFKIKSYRTIFGTKNWYYKCCSGTEP